MHYLVWLLLSALFFTIGEYYSKILSIKPTLHTLGIMLLFYILGSLSWAPAIIQKKNLIIAGTVWSILTMLATVCMGLYFDEKMTWKVGLGIILAIVSVILLSIE